MSVSPFSRRRLLPPQPPEAAKTGFNDSVVPYIRGREGSSTSLKLRKGTSDRSGCCHNRQKNRRLKRREFFEAIHDRFLLPPITDKSNYLHLVTNYITCRYQPFPTQAGYLYFLGILQQAGMQRYKSLTPRVPNTYIHGSHPSVAKYSLKH